MTTMRMVLGFVLMLVGFSLVLSPPMAHAAPDHGRTSAALGGLRVPFVANEGQTDPKVAFYAPTFAGTLFITRQGDLVYALPAGNGGSRDRHEVRSPGGWTLRERLAGGRARPAGQEPSATGVSYLIGDDPARWRPRVPTFEAVGLGEVWPGVTVSLHARGKSVEKIFTVRPGTPVSRIRVRVDGAMGLAVDADGALVARTGRGPVTFTPPVAFQENDGVRRPVPVAYRLAGREYGFTVGAYDRSKPLVIDPILQSSYLGGSGEDGGYGVAVHPVTGDVYVGGDTTSTNFPHVLGGVLPTYTGGSYDVFVAKLNGALTAFTQATYLGGSDIEFFGGIAIHPVTGEIYVTGDTFSSNFPGTGGGAQPLFGGVRDAFVARLGPSLTTLPQATYLGGSLADNGYALAIHPATGDIYVTGATFSTNFPKTAGGAYTTLAGDRDVFVARLNSALTTHIQSTYFGGNDFDQGYALEISPATGDVYLTGITYSHNLPGTGGGAQPAHGGGDTSDGYAARLTSTLTSLLQATYLGGNDYDSLGAIAIHPMTGDVYVAGTTSSTNFPGTAGGVQPAYGGGQYDGIVMRLTGSLTSLIQATYLGGSNSDNLYGGGIHPATGEIYVVGGTSSTNFPGTAGGAQPASGGGEDAYVTRLNASLTSIVQSTYLGGSGGDNALEITFPPGSTNALVVGRAGSTNFPAVAGGGQTTYGGGPTDAFATRLSYSLAAVDTLALSVVVNQRSFAVGQTVKVSIGLIDPGLPLNVDFYLGVIRPDGLFEFFTPGGLVIAPASSVQPVATGIPLTSPFAVPVPNIYTHQFTAGDPHGTYTFFFAALNGGNVVALAMAPYTLP